MLKGFALNDVYDIPEETTKEDELFDYADVPSYLKTIMIEIRINLI